MMTLTPEFKLVVETNIDMVLVRLSFLVITFHLFSQSSYETAVYENKVDTLNTVFTGKPTYDMLTYHSAYEMK
jgi:hypothetical protein